MQTSPNAPGYFRAVGGVGEPIELQKQASAAYDGSVFSPKSKSELTFEITGTSTSRTIAFELAGPSGKYVPCTVFSATDPSTNGSQTTGGTDALPEIWTVTVPGGCSFRTRVVSASGGYVSINGNSFAVVA